MSNFFIYFILLFFFLRQRLGESLNDLSLKKLSDLEQDVDNCLRIIRERKVFIPLPFLPLVLPASSNVSNLKQLLLLIKEILPVESISTYLNREHAL